MCENYKGNIKNERIRGETSRIKTELKKHQEWEKGWIMQKKNKKYLKETIKRVYLSTLLP